MNNIIFNTVLVFSSFTVGLFAKVGAGAVAELARQSIGPSQGKAQMGSRAVQSLMVALPRNEELTLSETHVGLV